MFALKNVVKGKKQLLKITFCTIGIVFKLQTCVRGHCYGSLTKFHNSDTIIYPIPNVKFGNDKRATFNYLCFTICIKFE